MFHFPFTSMPFVGSFIFVIIKRCDFLFPLSLWLQMVRFLGVVNMTWRRTCQDILFLLFRIESLFFFHAALGVAAMWNTRGKSAVWTHMCGHRKHFLSPHTLRQLLAQSDHSSQVTETMHRSDSSGTETGADALQLHKCLQVCLHLMPLSRSSSFSLWVLTNNDVYF